MLGDGRMRKKSFANRLILYFSCVTFAGFLAVYVLFNVVVDNYIRSEALSELNREVMTATTMPVMNVREDGLIVRSPGFSMNRAILNVNTILVDGQGNLLIPNPASLQTAELEKYTAIVDFWYKNRDVLATSDDMLQMTHAEHAFYMRASGMIIFTGLGFEISPFYAIAYTDVTPAMNLKNSMNQILLGLLAIAGTVTLSSSIVLAVRFNRSIKKLATQAQIIGQGDFGQHLANFNYSEFANLADNMNDMASMLATYETNQKQFFQNASHELRTPLMSIQGYTEGLKLGVFDNRDEATDIILEESHKMTSLIDDILYLSRLGATEDSQLRFEPAVVTDILHNCINRVQIIAKKAEKQVNADLQLPPSFTIFTDTDRLERAVINILSNAIRYANNAIRVEAVVADDFVKISIINDGVLIDENDLPHIFDRFYKASGGNTGLGLAITKDIVGRLKGQVEAHNDDESVRFTIKLPI